MQIKKQKHLENQKVPWWTEDCDKWIYNYDKFKTNLTEMVGGKCKVT